MLEIAYVIIAVLIIIMTLMGVRLWMYGSQIKHIKDELVMLDKEDTNYRLSSYCHIGKTEDLIEEFNLALDRYRKALRFLENDNRLYKESITSISHDIRTPLTSAKGYAQMLSGDAISEEKQKLYVKKIEKRIDDVTDMLNQLFEYTRVEAGELEFIMEKINLNNVFTETLSMFYDDFVAKRCEPVIDVMETPCYIYADKHAVIRIIENLIKNALVHGTGGYRISLVSENGQCTICISNRTNTLEEEDMDKLFDRFYTTDKSRSRKMTGLGLAIVKRFMAQMGGSAKAFLDDERFTIEVTFPVCEL